MNTLTVNGELTMQTARQHLPLLDHLRGPATVSIDLQHVGTADSAAVAVLLHWQRQARSLGLTLEIANPPTAIVRLLQVYGLQALLPAAPPAAA
ncbi:STAS domain-containing protein [Chitinilyticum litopenaei]|uniref:STAS domain-containing protein n=1 Tax=Chitinilyticum litopenaei TaxID=1121276 RepID=UPI000423C825|nr:STAS domain-containing protein [Chitinilyticum litopenaei]